MDSPNRPADWIRGGETVSEPEQEETGEMNADTNNARLEKKRERNTGTNIPGEEEEEGERYGDTKEEEKTAEDWFNPAWGYRQRFCSSLPQLRRAVASEVSARNWLGKPKR
ncbi:hypothetical protein NDU88_010915 [Pleurodeles waltl]|uniref:Uncharacterized protein n=1 Tax=Pleurodeles waltl TaxID=8319 RepID=A0AAV7R1L2_PLEWA|nr:hypothetical protein NDU88_010915 [Pleurodeles waltl]